jgi:hypothetical protein
MRKQIVLFLAFCALACACASAEEPAPKVDKPTLDRLAEGMMATDVESFRSAYEGLRRIASDKTSPEAAKAEEIVTSFRRDARRWLLSMGMDESDLDESLPVRSVTLNLAKETSVKDMRSIFLLPNIRIASVTGKGFKDDHLAMLSGFPELMIIDMPDTGVTGKAFEAGLSLPSLGVLRLDHCPITELDLRKCWIPKLEVLGVSHTQVGDEFLKDDALIKLKALYIDHTRVSSRGLRHLVDLIELKELRVDSTMIDRESMEIIGGLELEFLKIYCKREDKTRVAPLLRLINGDCHIKVEIE